jgi:hypothetical protein
MSVCVSVWVCVYPRVAHICIYLKKSRENIESEVSVSVRYVALGGAAAKEYVKTFWTVETFTKVGQTLFFRLVFLYKLALQTP